MHYVTRRSQWMQKQMFCVTCPNALFVETAPGLMETCEGLNPNLSVETDDNSIGEESRRSWPDYNYPVMLRLSKRYTNSRG
jgi:hypothetical protein